MIKNIRHKLLILLVLAGAGIFLLPGQASAAVMGDYCTIPSFVTQPAPPVVMFESGRDHKFYYEAFNDATDIDEDGMVDLTYKHTIDYYGYFDHHKCYTYSGGGSPQFNPVSKTETKFCSSTQWSGNVLNWLTMSRMDVLKKVLYGGERSTDSNETVLKRVYIPQDAHSWGKEFTGRLCSSGTTTYTYNCKRDSDCDSGYTCVDTAASGKYLIPFAATTPPNDCSFTSAIADINNKITVARYRHSNTSCGAFPNDLRNSYEPTAANFIDTFQITDFRDARLDPAPPAEHGLDYYNIFATAEFNVPNADKNKNWFFFIDSDDGAELQIDGTVVAANYGCHTDCATAPTTACNINQRGAIIPGSSGYHKIIVRHTETTGQDGVKVWYKISAAGTWYVFPCTNATCSSKLAYRAPNIVAGAECTIQSDSFINDGEPVRGTSGGQHLFCSTTLSDGGTPILRMVPDNTHRIWEWASKERPVCDDTFSDDSSTGTITDYDVKVKVCDSNIGLESNCKTYGGSSHKPTGLLQKYGENSTGEKVCSKSMTKPCNSNADCSFASGEGQCMYKADMFFGFMSTSYTNNLSGGVLRKNIGSILDETNFNNGYFQTSENVSGNIIMTFDRFRPIGFRYSDYSYQAATGGACGWITARGLAQGECRMWGNPIGEMMYEGLRYFAGKNTPTTAFNYTGQDSGLSLSLPTWGFRDGSTYYPPYTLFPACARPFTLVLSDVNASYDHDQLPGAFGSTFAEDSNLPMLNMNVSTLADVIGTTEGINGRNWFIGERGSFNNFLCTSKMINNLSNAKGLCPEEPTKKGTYYSAAVAYYGKKFMKENTGMPNVDTFVIALASPLADMKFKAGSNIVTVLPIGKSVSGGAGVFASCAAKCTPTYTALAGLSLGTCSADAYCPSNQIVDMYLDAIKYDAGKNVVYAKYRINFEDVEQGADHDMDAIVGYEICTQAAIDNGYGTCGGSLGSKIEVKLESQYGAGGIDQVLGFVIAGTTADGAYLVVKDKDVSGTDADTPVAVSSLKLQYSNIFTTPGTSTKLLNNPLWYAAKWGGFDDYDGDDKPYTSSTCGTATPDPLCKEWDKDGNGVPDNYFLVVNPQKLEDQMNAALRAMLTRASSGTAASVLASGEGSGANLIQAVYYPRKNFGNAEISWIGRLANLWYYVDPNLNNSSIREDAGRDLGNDTFEPGDRMLTLKTDADHNDHIVQLYFDPLAEITKAHRWKDANGDAVIDLPRTLPDLNFEAGGSLWEAGSLLWARNLSTSPRLIYTTITGNSRIDFSAGSASTLRPYLQAASNAESEAIIRYVHGEDTPFSPVISGITPTYRSRSVSVDGAGPYTWKLGDILNSTPKISSWLPLNKYHTMFKDRFKDGTYGYPDRTPSLSEPADPTRYVTSNRYRGRGRIFAGANDGMLHAFKLGTLELKWSGQGDYDKARLTGQTDAEPFGKEMWAFIPKNALPYLKYLADPAYCHVYTVDLTPFLFDASIGEPVAGDVSNTVRTVDHWRTILIGGMRFGGGCRKTGTCASGGDCVNTPVLDPLDPDKGLGYSSYFALDITDQDNPVVLWEFSHEQLGYSTAGPAVLRVSARDASNEPDPSLNGKWFVVLASGPTGPIDTDTKQFLARSDQPLRLFVLDLKTGVAQTINTPVAEGFAGSMIGTTMDTDLDYQDDVMYVPYVRKCTSSTAICNAGTWTDGGVLRLSTKEDVNPGNWAVSTLMDGIGPVTSSVAKQKNSRQLWTYFGTGRYFFSQDGVADDAANRRRIFGVKEPCFSSTSGSAEFLPDCTDSAGALTNVTDVANVETSPDFNTGYHGWYIDLDADYTYGNVTPVADPTVRAERVITDPLSTSSGVVFFTTYKPYSDQCSLGGTTSIWATKYNTGGDASALLRGQALIQVSTGSIEQLNLSEAFKDRAAQGQDRGKNTGNRKSDELKGVPPTAQGLSVITPPPPTKKVLHVRER